MAWGANFGAVGQTSYLAYGDDKNLVGYPYQGYSVFVVLDKHSLGPVADQVSEIETVQQTRLSASVGSVVTAGPAGIARRQRDLRSGRLQPDLQHLERTGQCQPPMCANKILINNLQGADFSFRTRPD
jgi:hypothetical protein